MNQVDAEEYTVSLGQIVAGSWRQIALAKRLGVPEALGLRVEDWVEQRLGGYIRLSISERKEAAKELVEEGMSQRAIGGVLGVDESTVREDLKPAGNPAPDYPEAAENNGFPESHAGNPAPPNEPTQTNGTARDSAADAREAARREAAQREAERIHGMNLALKEIVSASIYLTGNGVTDRFRKFLETEPQNVTIKGGAPAVRKKLAVFVSNVKKVIDTPTEAPGRD